MGSEVSLGVCWSVSASFQCVLWRSGVMWCGLFSLLMGGSICAGKIEMAVNSPRSCSGEDALALGRMQDVIADRGYWLHQGKWCLYSGWPSVICGLFASIAVSQSSNWPTTGFKNCNTDVLKIKAKDVSFKHGYFFLLYRHLLVTGLVAWRGVRHCQR